MSNCPKCNSTYTEAFNLVNQVGEHNLYKYVCHDCENEFFDVVKLNDPERILAILKCIKATNLNSLEECEKALDNLYNLDVGYEAIGFSNVFIEDIGVLENHINKLKGMED